MWISSRRFIPTLGVMLCVGACSDVTFEGGGPVTIQLSADRTSVPAGGSVTFTFEATGTYLNGVVVDYGDGVVDSVSTLGAQTAAGSVSHSFGLPGSYTVVGRAEDGVTGTATAEVVIQVGG